MNIINSAKTSNAEYIYAPLFTYERVGELENISMPFFEFNRVGNHFAAFIFGYPVFKVIGFNSELFGVPFYLGDVRWL